MAQLKRSGEIRLGDARMCILENPGHVDDGYERGFKREVFRRIIRRSIAWDGWWRSHRTKSNNIARVSRVSSVTAQKAI